MEDLKYPIGPFSGKDLEIPRHTRIRHIAEFPGKIKSFLNHLPEGGLSFTYRPDGWTVQQVIHHCADSHMNAVIRFKLALTEEEPTILPYRQPDWAVLPDSLLCDVHESLRILEGLHERWTTLLTHMSEDQYARIYIHPEHGKRFTLDEALAQYSWHCRHHMAHLQLALKRSE